MTSNILPTFVTWMAIAVSIADAADRVVVGTVKSVDAADSSITLTTKQQNETLDVAKKAKVTVNGQVATLKDVRSGQGATVIVNSDLEVATQIDATGDGLPEPEVAVLNELPPNPSSPWLSPDGLTLYFVTYEDRQGWIWSARRENKDSLFGEFKKLVPGRDQAVTSDGLEMILQNSSGLCSTTRKSIDKAFSRPRKIAEGDGLGHLAGMALSADGLTLYADRWAPGTTDFGTAPVELIQFKRMSRTSKWSSPEAVEFVDLPGRIRGRMRFLFVTSDELHAFAMNRAADQAQLLVFSRKSKSDPLGTPAVVSVQGETGFAQFPRYVESTSELFCMRPGQDGIVVIRNFNFETCTEPYALEESQSQ